MHHESSAKTTYYYRLIITLTQRINFRKKTKMMPLIQPGSPVRCPGHSAAGPDYDLLRLAATEKNQAVSAARRAKRLINASDFEKFSCISSGASATDP